jgi:RNA polymerase sigma-70 factor, ECF subfamily
MNPPSRGEVTQLLMDWSNGDREAFDKLAPLVYDELRRIARSKLHKHGSDALLQPTALLHEAYIRLVNEKSVKWQNRAHFYKFASSMIRNILIDALRKSAADKRGGDKNFVSLNADDAVSDAPGIDLLALNEALEKLVTLDPRQVAIIEMRFFGGMTNAEIAEALHISDKTVEREWRAAKAWLYAQLE